MLITFFMGELNIIFLKYISGIIMVIRNRNRKKHDKNPFEKTFLKTFLGEEYVDSLDILETGESESNHLNSSNGSENLTSLDLLPTEKFSTTLVSFDSESFVDLEAFPVSDINSGRRWSKPTLNNLLLEFDKNLKLLDDWAVSQLVILFPKYFSEPFVDLEAFIIEENTPEYSFECSLLILLALACKDLYRGFKEWLGFSKK